MSTSYRVFRNTSWAVIAKISYRISNSIIAILVSRFIGVKATGAYNVGLTYYTIGLSLAVWGFDQIMIREVAKSKDLVEKYFGNLLIMQTLFGVLTFCSILIISFLVPYPIQTRMLIRIFSLSIISESIILICQGVFLLLENVKAISIANSILSTVKVAIVFYAIYRNGELVNIAWIVTAISFISMAIFIYLTRQYLPKSDFKPDWRFGLEVIKSSFVIFLISIIFTVDSRIDIVALSFISDDYHVGLLTAALGIISFFYLFPQAFRDVIYPVLSHLHHSDPESTNKLYGFSTKYILLLTLPMAMGVSILSPEIINLIYKEAFLPAAPLLSIGIWAFPAYAIMIFNSRLLVVDYKGNFVVKALFVSSILLLLSNILLYPTFGIIVSAIIRVISTILVTLAIIIFVSKKLYKTYFMKFIPKIFLSLVTMSVIVYFLKDFSLLLSIISGAIIYFVVLFLLKLFDQQDISYWQTIYSSFISRNGK